MASTLALYGETGSGKTAQVGQFARYIYEKTGKITRYVGTDGGDWRRVLHDYIQAGIIESWDLYPLFTQKKDLYGIGHKLGRGEWPARNQQGQLVLGPTPPEIWPKIGAYALDSGTKLAEMIQENLELSPSMISGKEQTFRFTSDGESVSGGSWDHIRATQKTIARLVAWFSTLPVESVLWTFGEASGEDRLTKKTGYGLDVVGKALALKLPKDLGALFHCEQYPVFGQSADTVTNKPNPVGTRWRVYFLSHPDPVTGTLYAAKPRVSPLMHARLVKRWPSGFLEPGVENGELRDGLDSFLRFEDTLAGESAASVAAWKAVVDQGRLAKGGAVADKPA